jgi:hypothetical protein
MAQLLRLVVLSTLVATFAFVGAADAHRLELPRAAKANKTFAKSVCRATNDPEVVCVKATSGPCNRLSDHRARCTIDLTLESKENGSQARCQGLVEWYIKQKSPALRLNFLGFRPCKQVKPPDPEPLP